MPKVAHLGCTLGEAADALPIPFVFRDELTMSNTFASAHAVIIHANSERSRGPGSARAGKRFAACFPLNFPGPPPPPLNFPQNLCRKFDVATATDSVRFTLVGSSQNLSDWYQSMNWTSS